MRVPHRLRHPGRRGLAVIVVVPVAVAAAGGWMAFRPTSSSVQPQQITYTVTPRTVQQTVSATGTLAAAKQADLDFTVSGTVTKVYARVGDHVKKGQALARIDDGTLRANYNSAEAALSAANSAYDADADAGAGNSQLASDTAQIASAKATLSQAKDDLANATLRSTINGVVASRDLEVGDTVTGSSSSGSNSGGSSGSSGSAASQFGGTSSAASTTASSSSASSSSASSSASAFVVIQPGRFKVVADVSAEDISKVKKGMQVQLTTTSSSSSGGSGGGGFGGFGGGGLGSRGPGAGSTGRGSSGSDTTDSGSSGSGTIFGTVAAVSMVADSSSSSSGFPVTTEVTGVHKKLYAGTSVTVSIITRQLNNVLAVPAVALSSSHGKTYVTKVVGDKTVKTRVRVGQTFGAQTQITKGLSSGDKVQLNTGFTRTVSTPQNGGGSGRGGFPGGGFPGGGGLPSLGGGQ